MPAIVDFDSVTFVGASLTFVIALVDAVRHITRYTVPGAIVECGVWRGGSMMAVAMTLIEQGDTRGGVAAHLPPALV